MYFFRKFLFGFGWNKLLFIINNYMNIINIGYFFNFILLYKN